MDTEDIGSNEVIESGKIDGEARTGHSIDNTAVNANSGNLEGALGPLVQEIKLLRESFDEKCSRLDDKYTRLENVITSQKNDVSTEIIKLNESITA